MLRRSVAAQGIRALLVLVSLCALPGCGSDKSRDDARSNGTSDVPVLRLQLDSLASTEPAPALVRRETPTGEGLPWVRKRDRPLELRDTDMGKVVHVESKQPTNVRVRGEINTASFDRIDVRLRLPEGEVELMRISLYEGARKALVSDILTVPGTGEFQVVPVVLSGIELINVDVTEVSLQLAGQAAFAQVASFDILRQRPAALLPAPGSPARLVDHGTDARRGWGLDSEMGARWVARKEQIGGQRRLRFSYATGPLGEGGALEVSGLGNSPLRLPLQADHPGWSAFDHPLDEVQPNQSVTLKVVAAEEGADASSCQTAVAELHSEASGPEGTSAPLVLLVTSDTHRGDHLGRGGTDGLVKTPHLDALGLRGVQFTDTYSPCNMTNPSHVALMTGESPRDTRIVGNASPLDPAAVTLAERFQAAGWTTAAAVSVLHISHLYSGLGQGFDRFESPEFRTNYKNNRRDGRVAIGKGVEWIHERGDVPLFLWVHVFDVHGPYEADDQYEARYRGHRAELSSGLDPVPDVDIPTWMAGSEDLSMERLDAHARYRGAVDQLDTHLGPLLEHPRALEGVVGFTADHGESFGRHGLWWTHHGLYPDQLHVPLIVAGGGLPKGSQLKRPAEMISLGATLMELAGIDAGDHPARPLDTTGKRPEDPRFILGYGGEKAAVSSEGWLLIMNLRDHEFDRGPRTFAKGNVELYHVDEDPGCDDEVSAAEPKRTERMKSALLRWLADAREEGYVTTYNINTDALKRLIALGYTGAKASSRTGTWYEED